MDSLWGDWRHITKIDPDRENSPDLIDSICTQGVTDDKIEQILDQIDSHGLDIAVEPSNPYSVVQRDNYLFVPSVLNTREVSWLIGLHKEWIKNGDPIKWDTTFIEGYIVLNPDSAVAKLTESDTNLEKKDVVSYAIAGEKVMNLPIIYIEYSGTYGDPEVVEETAKALEKATLFYGGGIDDREKSRAMARYADTVIVGNVVYEKGVSALRETVEGAKEV